MIIQSERNWINHPDRTKSELIDALKRFNKNPEMLDIIEARLDDCFRGWQDAFSPLAESSRKDTHVHFRAEKKTFNKAKDAYIWLIENMLKLNSSMQGRVLQRMFIHGVNGGCYAAETLDELFHSDVKKIANHSLWHKLPNGWFLNLNLSNAQKLDRLLSLAAVVELKYGEDWSWSIDSEDESDLSDIDELLEK